MAKGAVAKQAVIKKISEAFGADYVGEYDKKIYVWAEENGEKVQIAMSLTCPKNPVETASAPARGDFNFEDDAPKMAVATKFEPAEITDEEQQNIADLMARLGL